MHPHRRMGVIQVVPVMVVGHGNVRFHMLIMVL